MAYEIVLGRGRQDRTKYGIEGSVLLGKHYVHMGRVTALAQEIYLDLNKAHVIFVAGKRGSGKSYCMGVIAEGIADLPDKYASRLSVILLDTMGIYWTMKYPNHRDEALLKEWGMEGKPTPGVKIYTPVGFYKEYKEKGIPTDAPFSIDPAELGPDDWFLAFELESTDPLAVFIERIIITLQKTKGKYTIKDIIAAIAEDKDEERHIRQGALNRFRSAESWGLFSPEATPLKDLAAGNQVTVLDLSAYAVMPNGWRIKHLALGLVCEKMFIQRMTARKDEEYKSIHQAVHYIFEEEKKEGKEEMPIVWLMIDEAHEFLPAEGKTASTMPLITLLREGRQPGIAMVLVTQQPGKIHTDAMTQSDIVLAHRLTAQVDIEALGNLMATYMRGALDRQLMNLPKLAGACIAIDDVNERLYPMRVRPRHSWHGGSAPKIVEEKKSAFEFKG